MKRRSKNQKPKHSVKHAERMVLLPESEYKLYLKLKPKLQKSEFKERKEEIFKKTTEL